MNKVKNITCILVGIVFTVFAALQYNDPDPYIWVPAYMTAAVFSIWVLYRPANRMLLTTLIIIYLIGAAYLWPSKYYGITMPMEYKPEIEEARESLGLILCGISFGWFLFISTKKKLYLNLKHPS